VFVYGWTADRGEVIAVRVDKNLLQMSTGGTFDLAKQLVGLGRPASNPTSVFPLTA